MEKIAVFVDDAEHARRVLAPLLARGAAGVSWVVVACAPRLTHRIGRWVSHSSREQWRERWALTLRERVEPLFTVPGSADRCEWMLAKGPLDRLAEKLRRRLGSDLRLLDARRPRLGTTPAPLAAGAAAPSPWAVPVAVSSGMSLVLALTD